METPALTRQQYNSRQYYLRNRDLVLARTKARKQANRAKECFYMLKRNYGLTKDQYQAKHDAQGGCCAICKTPQANLKQRLSVDHSHTTNRVRDLLCPSCNSGLGYFKDNPELLTKAATYLNYHNNLQNN